jgi:hypothetical protein
MEVLEEMVDSGGTGDDEVWVEEVTEAIVSFVHEEVFNFGLGDGFFLHHFVFNN